MQRDENLLHITNGQPIDAIRICYLQTGTVCTRRSGLLDLHQTGLNIVPWQKFF